MYNRLDRISACDGQTDGRASCYGIDRVTLLKITYAYIDIDVIDLKVEFLQVCGWRPHCFRCTNLSPAIAVGTPVI